MIYLGCWLTAFQNPDCLLVLINNQIYQSYIISYHYLWSPLSATVIHPHPLPYFELHPCFDIDHMACLISSFRRELKGPIFKDEVFHLSYTVPFKASTFKEFLRALWQELHTLLFNLLYFIRNSLKFASYYFHVIPFSMSFHIIYYD